MDENMKAEIEKSATYIGMTAEEAMSKFEEICSENNIETTNPIAKGLWRNLLQMCEEPKIQKVLNKRAMILTSKQHLVSSFLWMLQEI